MSVWDGIDRLAFDNDLAALYRHPRAKLQDASSLPELPPRATAAFPLDEQFMLDFETERRLAEDFAYLASPTTQPRDVAAAAVDATSTPPAACVYIASNEGVSMPVRELIETILGYAEQRAKRGLQAHEFIDLCLDQIARVHRPRIFACLGSKKAPNLTFHYMSETRLVTKVEAIIGKMQMNQKGKSKVRDDFLQQLGRFRSYANQAESSVSKSSEEVEALKQALRVAFDLTASASSFANRAGSASGMQKEIRAMQGLGNYYRICRSLCGISRRHRAAFQSVALRVLERPAREQRRGQELFVHAEVQLVCHFELHGTSRARFIGASKKPCFLCYCFIRAHGDFGICRSHGEVFQQWTLPSQAPYSAESCRRLGAAMQGTAGCVRDALFRSQGKHLRRLYSHPLQTVSKLLVGQARSLSNTTVESKTTEQGPCESSVVELQDADLLTVDVAETLAAQSQETEPSMPTGLMSSPEQPDRCSDSHYAESADSRSGTCIYQIVAGCTTIFHSEALEVFFGFERSSSDLSGASAGNFRAPSGTCRVRPVLLDSACTDDAPRVIDVQQLGRGDVIALEKSAGERILSFLLKSGREIYEFELTWT